MDRRDKLLGGLDLRNMTGIEIGALNRPLIRKSDGDVIYVDHADTRALREKYRDDPNVDTDAIVDVDIVWGAQTLQEALGGRKVDYIVASHVVEHVPDLLGWLEELRSVLKPGGQIRLAVPDRRYTFDYLRRPSSLADVLNAWLARPRAPLPIAILDFLLHFTTVNAADVWLGKLDPGRLKPENDVAGALAVARDALENGNYHDVHCWVFTPRSFAALFEQAAALDLMHFACESFHDTAYMTLEFIVAMRESAGQGSSAESWRRMRQNLPEDDEAGSRPPSGGDGGAALRQQLDRIEQLHLAELSQMRQLLSEIEARNRAAAAELEAARRHVAAMHASTSWRLTSPLRSAVRAVTGRR